jgi:hypothetical protein
MRVREVRVASALVAIGVLVAIAATAAGQPAAPRVTPGAPASLAMRPGSAHGGFVDDMDCSACHTTDGWALAARAGASGFDHDRTGFPLRGAHVQRRCTDCHGGAAKPRASCDSCHRDPHNGRHDGTCAECHAQVAWSDTRALDEHRRTRMPLTGRHAALDCTACHRRSGERAFSDTPTDCYACHRARYHGAELHPVHDGSSGDAAFPRECGRCHRTSAWTPAVVDPSTQLRALARTGGHDAWFVLSNGGHRTVACDACHPDARRSKLVRCDGCHDGSALRMQHRTPVARSVAACLGCHPRGASRRTAAPIGQAPREVLR